MKIIKSCCIYLLMLLVILQCNTLMVYFIVNKYYLIAIFGMIVVLFMLGRKFNIDRNKIYIALLYLFCMGVLFVFSDFRDIEFLFTIVATFVLFLLFLDSEECVAKVFEAFTNIMFVIASFSIFFFVFASLLNWIQPTGYYSNKVIEWGSLNYTSYYHLYYECQTIEAFGYKGMRNTAIFLEAPMFVYPLAIAIYYELFLRKDGYRKIVAGVFCAAMLTTFSTTGLLALVAILYLRFYADFKGTNFFKFVVTPCLIVVAAMGAVYIFYDKTVNGAHSVGLRGDDIIASLKCFLDHPVLGVGFEKLEALNEYCTIKRAQPSSSTGMGAVFAFGGLLLGLWYAIPLFVSIYKYIFNPQKRADLGIVILSSALFCVTIVETRVLCTVMNALSWLIIIGSVNFPDKAEDNKEF